MGVWGASVFENDSAADRLADLGAWLPETLEFTFRPVIAIESELRSCGQI